MESLKRMAWEVDRQNANDVLYRPLAPRNLASLAEVEPGDRRHEATERYTEPVLHRRRELEVTNGL